MLKAEIGHANKGEQQDHHHKNVGGNRKNPSRLTNAAQIGPAHQGQKQE